MANKEMLREAGYEAGGNPHFIGTIYPSPSSTPGTHSCFLGEVDHRQCICQGGGVAAEREGIQIVVLPFHEALHTAARGEICDAKTIIALQHLALLKAGNADIGTSW